MVITAMTAGCASSASAAIIERCGARRPAGRARSMRRVSRHGRNVDAAWMVWQGRNSPCSVFASAGRGAAVASYFCERKKTKGLPTGRPFIGGAAGRIRTHDPLVRSQVLYPTELQPHAKTKRYNIELKGPSVWKALEKGGAAGRIRTHDPLVRSQVLYPTELQPHAEAKL